VTNPLPLYLDDDSAESVLVPLLSADKHDVVIPTQVGNAGKKDASHFIYAIRNKRVLLTHNHDDFELLHQLVLLVVGHHPGILVVRRDNDRTRDMKAKAIVRAVRKLLASGIPIVDDLHILNHWR
jgi:predicted nuclease of predicted toxin-antitoxin system